MPKWKRIWLIALALGASAAGEYIVKTDPLPDRWFLTPEVWPNPWENWQIRNGEIVSLYATPGRPMTIHHLTHALTDTAAPASMRVILHRIGDKQGSAGFVVGIRVHDPIDDYRSRLLFGEGLFVGVSTKGELIIGSNVRTNLAPAEGWDMSKEPSMLLALDIVPDDQGLFTLTAAVSDVVSGDVLATAETKGVPAERLIGNVALVAGLPKGLSHCAEEALWAFHDWRLDGPKFAICPERSFGPILWSQYTLSKGILKLTAQMAPIGPLDSQTVALHLQRNGTWERVATTPIQALSWTAAFRIENWDDTADTPYRLTWMQQSAGLEPQEYSWEGLIRKDPKNKAAIRCTILCCFMDYLFPNRCVAENVARQDPDLLAFVGDQIYESVGGWGILRTGAIDRMCVNYLRKLALWGWSFRELTKDRPTVIMPDDHDVYQGNLWGASGQCILLDTWQGPSGYGDSKNDGSVGGYVQPIEFVKAVERTQTSHLPDPAITKTFEQGLTAYFTAMTYGGIGFAILEDRKFKTGPQQIAHRHSGPRPDHITEPGMAELVNDPSADLLGSDQLVFLRTWIGDWHGQAMKAAISQTVYCGVATHHGTYDNYLLGDMDSGGWPQAGRNRAIDILRRAGAVLLAGDQHLPTIVRHGIEEPGDGIVSVVTPAGATGYQRWWLPERMGIERISGGRHDARPDTGLYRDGFGNLIDVLAVGNPPPTFGEGISREQMGKEKCAGWGVVDFDKSVGAIRVQAWRVRPGLNVDASPRRDDQFPGWPHALNVSDCYGITAPKLAPIERAAVPGADAGETPPLVRVTDQAGHLISAGRILGPSYTPTVYGPGDYTVEVLSPKDDVTMLLKRGQTTN
ncbi:MAG TPA: hypothetical protein PLO37_23385 [Candidatus Hydrogenedentes bacterium]|nr:hypothetical protein [Candidatus Hydrogenedentota bacterium]HPG69804.1 hypothetical protein [Candidatus Hydrogenedentota bacterium]